MLCLVVEQIPTPDLVGTFCPKPFDQSRSQSTRLFLAFFYLEPGLAPNPLHLLDVDRLSRRPQNDQTTHIQRHHHSPRGTPLSDG
jgi:hypothetical protein